MSSMAKAIAEKIKKTFSSNSHRLKVYPAHHFAVRLYRTTGDASVKDTVLAHLLRERIDVLNDINNVQNRNYVKKRASALYSMIKKKKGKKWIERQRFFLHKKEYMFYYNLTEQLYFWRCFGISKGKFRNHYEKGLSIIRKNKAKIIRCMLDEGAVRCYGTQIVNYIYFLKFFGICDIREQFTDIWQGMFMRTDNLPKYVYQNKIYGMTHFIIAGSDYYQRLASKKEFNWILNYFQKNTKKIIHRTHIDIIAELGLCLMLCGINSGRALDTITNHVAGLYDKGLGFIPRIGFIPRSKEKDINVAEHTNAVSFMLLNGFRKLYPGPDVMEEFDANLKQGEV